jgi:hypothetical protein
MEPTRRLVIARHRQLLNALRGQRLITTPRGTCMHPWPAAARVLSPGSFTAADFGEDASDDLPSPPPVHASAA